MELVQVDVLRFSSRLNGLLLKYNSWLILGSDPWLSRYKITIVASSFARVGGRRKGRLPCEARMVPVPSLASGCPGLVARLGPPERSTGVEAVPLDTVVSTMAWEERQKRQDAGSSRTQGSKVPDSCVGEGRGTWRQHGQALTEPERYSH